MMKTSTNAMNLVKNEGVLIPHGVDGVGRHRPLGAELFLGVVGQPQDLRLHTHLHTLLAQELSGVDLERSAGEKPRESNDMWIWIMGLQV